MFNTGNSQNDIAVELFYVLFLLALFTLVFGSFFSAKTIGLSLSVLVISWLILLIFFKKGIDLPYLFLFESSFILLANLIIELTKNKLRNEKFFSLVMLKNIIFYSMWALAFSMVWTIANVFPYGTILRIINNGIHYFDGVSIMNILFWLFISPAFFYALLQSVKFITKDSFESVPFNAVSFSLSKIGMSFVVRSLLAAFLLLLYFSFSISFDLYQ